jgi:hypothetical protein
LFLAFFGFYLQKSDLKVITSEASLVFSEGREYGKIALDDFKGLPAASSSLPIPTRLENDGGNASEKISRPNQLRLISHEVSQPKGWGGNASEKMSRPNQLRLIAHEGSQPKGWGLDNASNTKEAPNEEKAIAASSIRGNNNDDVGVDQRVLRSGMKETKAKRPIASDLLHNARRPIVSNLLY